MADDEIAQVLFILQCRALQKLPQLPHLDAAVYLIKPLPNALHHLRLWPVAWVLQLRTGRHPEFVGGVKLGIDAVKATGNTPEVGSLLNVQGGRGHGSIWKSSGETLEQEELQMGDDLSS